MALVTTLTLFMALNPERIHYPLNYTYLIKAAASLRSYVQRKKGGGEVCDCGSLDLTLINQRRASKHSISILVLQDNYGGGGKPIHNKELVPDIDKLAYTTIPSRA